MTAYPVAANLGHWWLAMQPRQRRLHAIPKAALDPADEDAVESLCVGPWPALTAACGLSGPMTFPGVFSRLGLQRCANCCRKLETPAGNGTPANSGGVKYLKRPDGAANTTGPFTHTD